MPGAFDQTAVTRVQQANDIVDVIAEHVSLRKKGREMVGLCPFHEDHRPSLNVNPHKQIFKCFACGAGGDVFKFIQMREGLTFPQAIQRLADRAGVKIKPLRGKIQKPKGPDPNTLAKINTWAADYFQKNLHLPDTGKQARDYLSERQFTPDTIKKWRLGLALNTPDDLLKKANSEKLPTGLLEHAGLIAAQNQDKFINRLIFPITDVTGRIIGFGGRTLDDTGAKYINSPTTALFDKSNSLYGLHQARHEIVSSGVAIVVEGYTDVIMAHQFDCKNVVASLGTSFTDGQARILRRYAKKIVLVFDSDIAGIEAANRALEVCLAQHIDIELASVPKGKDPCEFLLTAGKDEFQKLTNNAVDVFEFKWDRLTERFDTDDTFAGRKAAAEEYLQAVATAMQAGNLPPIEKGLMVNRLANIIGLDAKQIDSQLRQRTERLARAASRRQNLKTPSANLGRGLFASAQREILEILLNEPRLFDRVKQKISPDAFDVPIFREMVGIIFQTLNNDINAPLTAMTAGTESVQTAQRLVQLQQEGEKKGKFQTRLDDALNVFLRLKAKTRADGLKTADDQKQFLNHVSETIDKENRHNIGMV